MRDANGEEEWNDAKSEEDKGGVVRQRQRLMNCERNLITKKWSWFWRRRGRWVTSGQLIVPFAWALYFCFRKSRVGSFHVEEKIPMKKLILRKSAAKHNIKLHDSHQQGIWVDRATNRKRNHPGFVSGCHDDWVDIMTNAAKAWIKIIYVHIYTSNRNLSTGIIP